MKREHNRHFLNHRSFCAFYFVAPSAKIQWQSNSKFHHSLSIPFSKTKLSIFSSCRLVCRFECSRETRNRRQWGRRDIVTSTTTNSRIRMLLLRRGRSSVSHSKVTQRDRRLGVEEELLQHLEVTRIFRLPLICGGGSCEFDTIERCSQPPKLVR